MLREGKSCFQQGKSFSTKGNPVSKKGNPAFRGKPIRRQNLKTTGGPGQARIGPAGIFPTSAFVAEVGREKSHSEASRRSGVGCAAGGLRGGRAADLPPGSFAEVGYASKADPGGRESNRPGKGQANPSQAKIFPTSVIFQRSGNFLSSINLPDLLVAPLRQDSGIKPITIPYPAIQIFHFPTNKLAVRNYAQLRPQNPKRSHEMKIAAFTFALRKSKKSSNKSSATRPCLSDLHLV